MTNEEFLDNFYNIFNRAMNFSEKARSEGLLALEEDIESDKVDNRDIFEYGMRFTLDGTDKGIIDKILSNLIEQHSDPFELCYKKVQIEAVLSIQAGDNPRVMLASMASHIGNPELLEIEKLLSGDIELLPG